MEADMLKIVQFVRGAVRVMIKMSRAMEMIKRMSRIKISLLEILIAVVLVESLSLGVNFFSRYFFELVERCSVKDLEMVSSIIATIAVIMMLVLVEFLRRRGGDDRGSKDDEGIK